MNEDTDGEPNSGEWIDWAGGDCPVGSDVIVRLRSGKVFEYHAPWLMWAHLGDECDIVAYQVAP